VEIGLDANCCAMALTSSFAKIGTFCNANVLIITHLFSPSTIVGAIANTF
jgi:hypothetical protein